MLDFRKYIHKLNNNLEEEEDVEYSLRTVMVSTTSYVVGQVPSICYDEVVYVPKYYRKPVSYTDPFPVDGDKLYDDEELTTEFNGSGIFYKLKWGTGSASAQVSSVGVLNLVSHCAPTIELGYSSALASEACDNQFANADIYYSDDLGQGIYMDAGLTIPAPSGYYAGFLPFGGTINKEWREWNGSSFVASGECF